MAFIRRDDPFVQRQVPGGERDGFPRGRQVNGAVVVQVPAREIEPVRVGVHVQGAPTGSRIVGLNLRHQALVHQRRRLILA